MQKLKEYIAENKYTDNQRIGIAKNGNIDIVTVRNIKLITKPEKAEVISVTETYIKGMGIISVFILYE